MSRKLNDVDYQMTVLEFRTDEGSEDVTLEAVFRNQRPSS